MQFIFSNRLYIEFHEFRLDRFGCKGNLYILHTTLQPPEFIEF